MAFAWALIWLYDQRMYDDDYGRWLNPAREVGYLQLLWELMRPFPPDWGFLDRPGVMLSFKLGGQLFGASVLPWFLAKAAAFAVLVGCFARVAQLAASSVGFKPRTAVYSALGASALLLTSDAAFASLVWLSDLEVVAQLAVVAGVLVYLRGAPGAGDDPRALRTGVILFVLVFIGFKFKATAKLFPLLLGAQLLVFDRRTLRRFGPIALLLAAACVPWLALGSSPLPPMVDFGRQFESFHWQPASAGAALTLLWGAGPELLPIGTPDGLPTGILQTWFPFGLILSCAGGWLAGVAAFGQGAKPAGLVLIWLLLGLATLCISPDLPAPMLGRYLLGVQLPLALLAGLGLAWAFEAASAGRRWLPAAALLLCVLQLLVGFSHTRARKLSQGCQFSISDKTAEFVYQSMRSSTVVFLGFPVPAFDDRRKAAEAVSADPRDPSLEARLRSLGYRGAIVTDGPLTSAAWIERMHFRAEDSLYWRLIGPPVGRCERYVYRPR